MVGWFGFPCYTFGAMDEFFTINWDALAAFGSNPYAGMWWLFMNGGWIVFLWLFLWMAREMFLAWRQGIFAAKRSFVVLAVSVPRMQEQGPRAVDNMFAYLSAAHGGQSWKEKWIDGAFQNVISCEIASFEGRIQYMFRVVKGHRDLVEAAVYAQYPDAEIVEIQDYAKVPASKFEDPDWDLWGTEMVPVKPDVFPLRTYPDFEDPVSQEFKDPMTGLLEGFARLGEGEQAWFQIILTPVGQGDFQKATSAMVKKLKGEKVEAKKGLLMEIAEAPFNVLMWVVDGLIGSAPAKPPEKKEAGNKMQGMTQMEKDTIHAVERKASKIVYQVKMRFIYVAKRQNSAKQKIIMPFMGSLKQLAANNLQALKPENKKTGINGSLIWFKTWRNAGRKTRLMANYRARDASAGAATFHLNTEELATLWHFPHSFQVKAPQIQKTESKRTEPPTNLPFG